MRLFKLQCLRVLICAISLGLVACGGGSGDKLVDGLLDGAKKDEQVTLSLVNALGERATFFAKSTSLSRSVFDEKQKIADVSQGSVSEGVFYKFNRKANKTQFGVRDTGTQKISTTLDLDLENKAKYWTIAWLNNNVYQLSIFKKSVSNEAGVFRVRVFSNSVQDVTINGDSTVVATTEKGKVTGFFSISDCSTGLNVGGNFIELCNDAVFGKSYIAVVDQNGKVVVAEE